MDVTLRIRKRYNKRHATRNGRAWTYHFAHLDSTCRYCPHDHTTHLTLSGQPHFLTSNGERRIVARDAEIIRTFCTACADEIGTSQVVCYQRGIAVGERVGATDHRHHAWK